MNTAPIPMPGVTVTLVNGRTAKRTDRVFITPTVAKRSNYDGSFKQDYEYKRGSGDLDECNLGNTMESIRILQHKLFLSSRGVIGDILVEIS